MPTLRIGFFTEVYRPVVNGVVASVEALAQGLRTRGHEVYCFTPRMPGYEDPGRAPARESILRMPSLPLPTRTPYRLTLPLVSRRNVNNIVKRLSLVHVHSPFVTGWMGLRYARRYGMPLVYTYHTQLEAYAHYVPFEPNATRYAASQLTRRFANLADAVVVPTPAMATHLRDLGVVVRIEVVPSGIDVDRFGEGRRDERLRASLGAGAADRLLLCVSRLAKEKNLELLLDALALAGDSRLKLAIAGDGPARDELVEYARSRGVADRTRFLGVVDREGLPDLYASADAFVMPSTTETQGLVQAEALAAGAFVIAADAPPNRDVLGQAGAIATAAPQAFAAAFSAIPATPSAEIAMLARRRASRFSIGAQVDRMLGLYASLAPGDGLFADRELTPNVRSV
ncbi:MAG: glycosyltransferase [Candidatus Eremiobacteraeota bacterium]|nr:glycosyltransferase [Candidatus Eremiobacteraeota bacterium]